MRIIISESQYKLILENEEKKEISPGKLKKYKETIKDKGLMKASRLLNKEIYELIEMGVVENYDGNLDLKLTPIKSLGNLKYVGGNLELSGTKIKTLGDLEVVGGNFPFEGKLELLNCEELTDFGKLKYVDGYLNLIGCPLSKLSNDEIRSKVEIKGKIYR